MLQTPSSEEDLEVTVEVLWPRLDSEAGGSIGLSSGSEAGGKEDPAVWYSNRAGLSPPCDTRFFLHDLVF